MHRRVDIWLLFFHMVGKCIDEVQFRLSRAGSKVVVGQYLSLKPAIVMLIVGVCVVVVNVAVVVVMVVMSVTVVVVSVVVVVVVTVGECDGGGEGNSGLILSNSGHDGCGECGGGCGVQRVCWWQW